MVFKDVHSTLGAHGGGGERGLHEGQLWVVPCRPSLDYLMLYSMMSKESPL